MSESYTNPYAISAKARWNIIGMCRNGSALRMCIDNYRSHEVLIAYNEKLIAICRSNDVRYLLRFVQENRHQLFIGYRGRAAISALQGRFVCAHRYLIDELDISEDIQIEKIIMLNHSDQHIRLSTKFDPRVAVQIATEKEFGKLVSCVCAVGDRYLIARLLEYRIGWDGTNIGSQPLHINALVVGMAATSYLKNYSLFGIFLSPFVNKARTNTDLRHYAKYILRHAAEGGDRQTWELALTYIEFQWLGYSHSSVPDLEDYALIPPHILPYLIEICAESQTRRMLSMFIDYVRPHVNMFGPEYRKCIIKLVNLGAERAKVLQTQAHIPDSHMYDGWNSNEYMDTALYLILGYAMTDAETELFWDAFDGHPCRNSLIESVMIANAAFNVQIDGALDQEHIVPSSPAFVSNMPQSWPF